jgi:hypothetical protein
VIVSLCILANHAGFRLQKQIRKKWVQISVNLKKRLHSFVLMASSIRILILLVKLSYFSKYKFTL